MNDIFKINFLNSISGTIKLRKNYYAFLEAHKKLIFQINYEDFVKN
jgi:hypothetical protein